MDEDESGIYPCMYRRLTHPVVENRKKLLIILCKKVFSTLRTVRTVRVPLTGLTSLTSTYCTHYG